MPILVDLYGVLSLSRRHGALRAGLRAAAQGQAARAHRGVPAEHGPRPLAGRPGREREAADRPEERSAAGAARPPRPPAAPRGGRRLPRPDRARRVPGHHQGQEMDAILRSHIQFQGEVASFIFAGSEPGLMRELFEAKERPLYGQAVPMRLGRLADADIAPYVIERFRQSGRSAGEHAERAAGRRPRPPAAHDAARPSPLGGGRARRDGHPRRTGRERGRRPSPSCSPSSMRTGGGSPPTRRRRCAP